MTHTYKVTGMTCTGCKTSVENYLKSVPDVEEVAIDLETEKVTITMKTHIDIDAFKKALPQKYQISNSEKTNVFSLRQNDLKEDKTDLRQLSPLFIILGYISIASLLLNYQIWDTSSFMLDFMGLFYIVFSFFKFLDLKGFPESFKMYDPLAKVFPAYARIYPFIEVALGLAFLMRFQIETSLIVTIIILGITTIGVTKALFNNAAIQCACLGTALKLPMTKATFIENTLMIIMASFMLIKIYMG